MVEKDKILIIDQLSISFGGVHALDGLDLEIREHEIFGLIGPNGSGKTTLINAVSGIYRPNRGRVLFPDGKTNIVNQKPHIIARKGIARTFQRTAPFLSLTSLENVMVGRQHLTKEGLFRTIFRLRKETAEEKRGKEKALETLKLVSLHQKAKEDLSRLTFGELRLLDLARALATQPKLMLLDEPAAGMNYMEMNFMNGILRKICDHMGITILLVEHNMKLIMEICDRICVLNFGKKVCEGTPEKIKNDPRAIKAYLGS